MTAMTIRPMTEADLPAVLRIEKVSFSSPWTAAMFIAELRENLCSKFLVAMMDGTIVGYIGGWIIADELHLLSLAVDPVSRRLGVASRLVEALYRQGRVRIVRAGLEVRASNHAALVLYRSLGFRAVGVRPNYYADPREDAVIMEWTARSEGGSDDDRGRRGSDRTPSENP